MGELVAQLPKANARVDGMLEALGKEIPFFKQVQTAAQEKGYKFQIFDETAPVAVKALFKADSVSVTDKEANKVYFNLDKLEALVKKHAGQTNFAVGLAEQLANEGVQIIEKLGYIMRLPEQDNKD